MKLKELLNTPIRRMVARNIALSLVVGISLLYVALRDSRRMHSETVMFSTMSTFGTVSLAHQEKMIVSNALTAAHEAIREVEKTCNIFDPESELSKLNATAADEPFACSDLLWDVLQMFYLTLAMAKRENKITVEQVKEIFSATFGNELDFSNLKDVLFVGDGTYLLFDDKYIEIRPSGTDAKTKAYGAGLNLDEIGKFATAMGNYSGERTEMHKKYITDEMYNSTKDKAMDYYLEFVNVDANNEKFEIPEYKF